MQTYKTPGVYIEEVSKFPPSVAAVETAIPAFIGYTEKARLKEENDLRNKPFRITSLFDYERFFGQAQPETGITVTINTAAPNENRAAITDASPYLMYYSLQAFFANGGGPCYIVSTGDYSSTIVDFGVLSAGLEAVETVNEVTLLVFPDSINLPSATDFYNLQKSSLDQCVELQDRFAVMDIWEDADDTVNNIEVMRSTLSGPTEVLKYGAAYYPQLETIIDYLYDPTAVVVSVDGAENPLEALKSTNNVAYNQAKAVITQLPIILPPSSAVVGVYAQVDSSRGVWKAPANINIDFVIRPVKTITRSEQDGLNVDAVAGKSINAIRSFTGRGPAIIWGARTLAGNDNEWRYVSVRRFFNMVEESVKNATEQFVFEPNDLNTWTRVKSMISNFLNLQWRAGALQGTTPEQAYYVKIGLNETMDALDILEGRMIVEIGMAVVRPAEFIILKFSHKMPES